MLYEDVFVEPRKTHIDEACHDFEVDRDESDTFFQNPQKTEAVFTPETPIITLSPSLSIL